MEDGDFAMVVETLSSLWDAGRLKVGKGSYSSRL
jgi:hypothetical protein